MNRRNFLSTVAALPFMGWVVAKASSDVVPFVPKPVTYTLNPRPQAEPMTATEVRRRYAEMIGEPVNPPILVDMGNNMTGEFRDGRWHYFKETDELG